MLTLIDGDRIVVHTPQTDPMLSTELSERFGIFGRRLADEMSRSAPFNAEMRFTLVDAKFRVWQAERYCYRGSIDSWIEIGRRDFLDSLAENLLPHLGRESFFELY